MKTGNKGLIHCQCGGFTKNGWKCYNNVKYCEFCDTEDWSTDDENSALPSQEQITF